MLIAGIHPRGRTGALVVTAAAALLLGIASPALARTSGPEANATVRPAELIPDASWHGRPIRNPDATPIQVRRPVSSTEIRDGQGLGRPGGSDAVREVQRRLAALGYRTGPVDGAFGPRTRSSVAWFQIKHRLAPTGAVDGMTLGALRFRTHGVATATTVVAHGDPAPPRLLAFAGPPKPSPVATRPEPAHKPGGTPLALILVALGLAMVAVAAIATWLRDGARVPERAQLRRILRERAQAKRVPARSSAPRRGRAPGAVAAPTNGRAPRAVAAPTNGNGNGNGRHASGQRVIGYAVGRSEQEFARQQRAIERVCGERGWKLTAVVKERDGHGHKRRARPGRKRVLAQVAAGGVGQLVVGRLGSLAASPAELAVVLEWCRRREVGLLALDVGLDTTTADGRVAARCLGAVVTRSARTSGAH